MRRTRKQQTNYIHATDEYNAENADKSVVTDAEELRTLVFYTVVNYWDMDSDRGMLML
jgi:hypothetical protein